MIAANCMDKEFPGDDSEKSGSIEKSPEFKSTVQFDEVSVKALKKKKLKQKQKEAAKNKKKDSENSRPISGGRKVDKNTPFGKNLPRKKHFMYLRNKNIAPPPTKYPKAALYKQK